MSLAFPPGDFRPADYRMAERNSHHGLAGQPRYVAAPLVSLAIRIAFKARLAAPGAIGAGLARDPLAAFNDLETI